MGKVLAETASEKKIFFRYLKSKAGGLSVDDFVWGEELYDKKLIVYGKKHCQIPEYERVERNLRPCGLVVVESSEERKLRYVAANIDMRTGNIYVTESSFNSIWKDLRKSVELGVLRACALGKVCEIKEPEEILILEDLFRNGALPSVVDGKIQYESTPVPPEKRRLTGRRQSLLDNSEMRYFYSEEAPYYHDKSCGMTRKDSAGAILRFERYSKRKKDLSAVRANGLSSDGMFSECEADSLL